MHSNDSPILSVIIPTKNRSQYVVPCVKSLMKIRAQEIEIIVQDNSDDDQTVKAIAPLTNDRRILLNHCTDQLSMQDNFTKGLEAASGDYIAFLGDDDGINPELFKAVLWAKAEGLDALVGTSAAYYRWPDVILSIYGKYLSSTLFIKPFSSTVTYPNPETEIHRCIRMAGCSFGNLPKAYHGVVRRESLNRIFETAGTFFPGPTPDMASAIALATIINRYAHIDYPFFIIGTGRVSGGGAGSEKKHDWSLESVPWFSRSSIELWSSVVPRYCSGTTLWGEDVIQALQAMGRVEMLQHFNAIFLYARCAVFNRRHNKETLISFNRFLRDKELSKIWAKFIFFYYYIRTWYERFSSLTSNTIILAGMSHTKRITNVPNIYQAVEALKVFLRVNDRHFNEKITP